MEENDEMFLMIGLYGMFFILFVGSLIFTGAGWVPSNSEPLIPLYRFLGIKNDYLIIFFLLFSFVWCIGWIIAGSINKKGS